MTEPVEVVALGNALVDVLAHDDGAFIEEHGLLRGAALMVDAERSELLYQAMGPAIEVSGGSAANTAAGVASFGGTAAFVGKVRDDQLGRVFVHDLRAAGVAFDTPPATEGPPTGRCLVIVTPDAQRTMCTYLGAAEQLGPGDVDEDLVARARVLYVEGYLWDQSPAKEAIRVAMAAAHRAHTLVALSLSDPFCVDRHRGELLELVRGEVDVLFANDEEIRSLYGVDDFDAALRHVGRHCEIAALTRGEHGSVVVSGDEVHVVAAHPAPVLDTTGAGDLYAAGFLSGLTRGCDLATCGRLGALAAAEVISHLGARPQTRLRDLAHGLLA